MEQVHSLDPELSAMNNILAALEPLTDEARLRVLSWASARFELAPAPLAIPNGQDAPTVAAIAAPMPSATSASAVEFATLGELFGTASPRTMAEKALVAGYWLQVKGGAEDLNSQAINTELKHLGHGIANITGALEELKGMKPALAIQLRKSGASQQARKKYKITAAGEKRVEELVRNGTVA